MSATITRISWEITYVSLPNGGTEFTPVILGLGLVYEVFWSFGDFLNSIKLWPPGRVIQIKKMNI